MYRVLFASVVVAVFGVGGASALAAGNPGTTSVVTEPAEFTLPSGQCADLPAGVSVHGTGTARIVFHESIDATGKFHLVTKTTISGTALSSDGTQYRFNYHNTQSLSPAADFPFVVTITDHFNLVGAGGASQIHTSFVLKVLVTSPTTEEVLRAHFRGDSSTCDPL